MSDLISRQAAIDVLRTCYDTETITMDNGDEYINYGDAVGEIKQLPPIQPANCSEFPNNSDAISRQSVIDVLDETRRIAERNIDGAVLMTFEKVLDSLVNITNALPNIQPEIVRCKDCKYAEYIDDVKTLWCTECGQGRTVAPYDFCSYAEKKDDDVTCENCDYSEKFIDGLILCRRTKTSHRVSATSTCGKGKRGEP